MTSKVSVPNLAAKKKLLARIAAAEKQVESAKKMVKQTKIGFKQAKQRFKEAKRAAKKQRKAIKALKAELAALTVKKSARRKSGARPVKRLRPVLKLALPVTPAAATEASVVAEGQADGSLPAQ